MVHVDGREQFLRSLLAVDELPLGDGAGVQDPVPASHRQSHPQVQLSLRFVPQKYNVSRVLPLAEVSVEDPAGESLPADPDALQHAVTPQLVQDQMVIHRPCTEETFPPSGSLHTENHSLWALV